MSLSTTANKVILSGNGVTTSWPFTFPIPDATYLSVIYTDTAGVETTLSTSLYSVTGIGTTAGGSVIYPLSGSPIVTGTKLTLLRTVPNTQPTILSNQGGYYPEVVEAVFDRLTMMVQQLTEKVARALVAPASDSSVGALPSATQRASTFLGFDSSGNPIAVALSTTILTVSNFIQNSLLPAASASAARVVLGLGAGVPMPVPQGRLTLVTATPVMTSSQASKTTIFYTPYQGNLVPIYDGSNFVPTVFAELSNLTTASSVGSAGPAAVTTNSNYDLFVWSNAGAATLTRGPPWTSDTGRGTGAGTTQLTRVLGILTNAVAITNGPGAGLGTYVGTVRSDGSSQINWAFGGYGANGTPALLGVWNMYNRVDVRGSISDTTDSWTYGTATIRPTNNSAGWRVSWVQGVAEEFVSADHVMRYLNNGGAGSAFIGLGLNSTTAFTAQNAIANASNTILVYISAGTEQNLLGFNFLQALEEGDGVNGISWSGDGGFANPLSRLRYSGRF